MPPETEALLTSLGVRERRIEVMGVPLDPLTMDETLDVIDRAIAGRVPLKHVVVNVAKLISMRQNPRLASDVTGSDIINADGMGIVWGARILGLPLPERVAGVDLMERLLALCARRGYRPYILGARPEVLERAVANIRQRHPSIRFAGWRHGYFDPAEEPDVIDEIRESHADCLFVAISSPMKERITEQYRDRLGVPFIMGVGGSVDVLAGVTRRAPVLVQRCGMEWAFRLAQEPHRMWRRYLTTNSAFLGLLLREWARRRIQPNGMDMTP
ncbi:WecB/TagA/CpsF family glycosyltransferase [Azospirillum oleiclasticum]|nr:WecB/TagA/CpsF family glycosyltransferase [Azospirillum oleiclasticum]